MTHPALVATLLDAPVMRSGSGSWLVDIEDNRYLDCVAGPGVHLLGHGHPAVISAIEHQAGKLIHSSFQLNEPIIALAEELTTLAGEPFQRVFFANSGSEAIETAIKLAKKVQASRGRFGHSLAAFEDGYHGRSGIALALTGMSVYKTGLPGFSLYPGIVHLPVPRTGDVHLNELGRQLDARLQDDLLAVVAEPVLGVGGVIVPPDGFLRLLRELCDARNALLIFDEIFTGLGRTGTTFAFQRSGVRPDILVVGKPLGAGLPVGAVLTSDEIGSCWAPVDHSTTFGGNGALVGAVGRAVLGELVAGDLAAAAERAGNQLLDALRSAAPAGVEVRGQGLLIGLKWPSSAQAVEFRRGMMARGVLVGVGGQRRSVVRLTPPLNITAEELKLLERTVLDAIDEVVNPVTAGVLGTSAVAAAARLTGTEKRDVLHAVAAAMSARFDEIVTTNRREFEQAERAGTVAGKALRRMLIERPRFDRIIDGVRWLAESPDPVGETADIRRQPNGLWVGRMRVPLGVIAAVYESRPEVTLEASAMALKSGNAIILRGGHESTQTNQLLVRIIQACLADFDIDPGITRYVDDPSREALWELLTGSSQIDLIVARGSDAFIAEVRRRSPFPVLASGGGNCHIYVDASADLDSATQVVLNAKLSAPTMCNAVETVLVHAVHASGYVRELVTELHRAEVAVHGCPQVCAAAAAATPADQEDWRTEFLGPTVAMRVVPDMATAIDHINTYGTGHSEAIITADLANARDFQYAVDAAAVYVNASTRFTYGYEFGLGPMLGISTQKLHVRGPISVTDLTSQKFVITGAGQLRTTP